jgi:ureidoglycolate lyase
MDTIEPVRISARSLTREAYAPFGDVIEADESLPHKAANFGRAKRFNHLAHPVNQRPHSAAPNICVFRCNAYTEPTLTVDVLERHAHSTQMFLPMQDGKYVTIVALGADQPDLSSLCAFVIEGPHGISYHPGVWHYPMTALGRQLDMACLVFEDGTDGDCHVAPLQTPVIVKL